MKPAAKHVIVGVNITNRVKHIRQVQQVFTDFGCQIRTRLGLHDAGAGYCSPNGLILLEMVGTASDTAAMLRRLKAIAGVEAKKFEFKK